MPKIKDLWFCDIVDLMIVVVGTVQKKIELNLAFQVNKQLRSL